MSEAKVPLYLTQDQMGELRMALTSAYNHWNDKARMSAEEDDRRSSKALAEMARKLFELVCEVDPRMIELKAREEARRAAER